MTAGQLVVFPSNKALSLRAHGMAETTLRRHLGELVRAGLVDPAGQPERQALCHRGAEGVETGAFGFDLSPVLARAEEFERLAAEASAARASGGHGARARHDLSAGHRQDDRGRGGGRGRGAWQGYREAFAALCYRLPRKVTHDQRGAAGGRPACACGRDRQGSGESVSKLRIWTGNDIHSGAQIENSNPDPLLILNLHSRKGRRRGRRKPCRCRWC